MKSSKSLALVALLVALLALSAAAVAPTLTYNFKDVKAPGAVETDTYSLNDAGVIAGDYVDSSAVQHGMILKGTKLTKVDDSDCEALTGSTGIAFYGINSAGTAVGWCTLSKTGYPIGLLYAKGKLTEFSVPSAIETEANGINDKGNIVGMFFDSNGVEHGFLLVGKKYTQIDAPSPDTSTVAWSINDKGQIGLYAINSAGGYDAFVLTGKKFTQYKDPNQGSTGLVTHKINNKGAVDGTYYDSAGATHGWVYTGGKYYSLDDPEGTDTRADGLTDTLVVVGRWGSGTYGGTGFEATPKK